MSCKRTKAQKKITAVDDWRKSADDRRSPGSESLSSGNESRKSGNEFRSSGNEFRKPDIESRKSGNDWRKSADGCRKPADASLLCKNGYFGIKKRLLTSRRLKKLSSVNSVFSVAGFEQRIMNNKLKQSGFSLVEMMVVIAVVAILTAIAIPAIRALENSFYSVGSVRAVITAAISKAKAIAAKEHRYAGIRFQKDLNGDQYIVYIIHDPTLIDITGFQKVNGFRVVQGLKPIKLPKTIRVTDFMVGGSVAIPVERLVVSDVDLLTNPFKKDVSDITTFSMVFSPVGKLVIRPVQVLPAGVWDTVFNYLNNPNLVTYIFECDWDNTAFGYPYQQEPSRNNFVIYEKEKFDKALAAGTPYTGYLNVSGLTPLYINPYTATIINYE